MDRRKVYLYLHTHWDREWYRSFESYRLRLCEVICDVLVKLESNPHLSFLLDGQTVILEDFLEIYPEQRPRLQALIRAGRLQVGPWYVLPDEFLVSGEALIRNLIRGHQQAAAFGQTRGYGYLPDMFGHVAQMPQLLKQCGLEPAILWRGVSPQKNIFQWMALDGTALICLHLTQGYYMDLFHRQPLDHAALTRLLQTLAEATPDQAPLLLPVGGDHLGLPPDLAQACADYQASEPGFSLSLGTLDSYFKELFAIPLTMESIHGELRDCESAYLLPGVLSSRRYLKLANDRLQNLLTHQVEPLLLRQWLQHKTLPQAPLLAQAWKYLLQNHPHDSICGCSIDAAHQDMLSRFRWVETLVQELRERALQALFSVPRSGEPGTYLHLLNLGPTDYTGTLSLTLEFPSEQGVQSFSLEDMTGMPLPYEILTREETGKFVAEPDILPHWEKITRFQCLLATRIPANSSQKIEVIPHTTPLLPLSRRSSEDIPVIENAWCRIQLDSRTGLLQFERQENKTWVQVLAGHFFVDEGDAGDTYNFSPPQENARVVFHIQEVSTHKQALCQQLRLRYFAALPAQLREDRQARSGVHVPCQITTVITLYSNDPSIYFHSQVENQARDHRLRLFFQFSDDAWRCWSSTAFGVVERTPPLPHPWDVPAGQERPADTFPFEDWIHLTSADQGFVFYGEGLHEAELCQWEGQPALAITLLRCVGWLSRDDLRTRGGGAGPRIKTPEAQCLGSHPFDYHIAFCGPERTAMLRQVQQWQYPPLSIQGNSSTEMAPLYTLHSPGFIVSSLKKAEGQEAWILRLVNLCDHPAPLDLEIHVPLQRICLSDPLEQRESDQGFQYQDQHLTLCSRPYEILTFKLFPDWVDTSL